MVLLRLRRSFELLNKTLDKILFCANLRENQKGGKMALKTYEIVFVILKGRKGRKEIKCELVKAASLMLACQKIKSRYGENKIVFKAAKEKTTESKEKAAFYVEDVFEDVARVMKKIFKSD